MLYNLVQTILRKAGKNYTVDTRISNRLLFYVLLRRMVFLLRGILCTQSKLYMGSCVLFQGGLGKFTAGKSVTLENNVTINAHVTDEFSLGNYSKIGAYTHVMGTAHLSRIGKSFIMGDYSACSEFCYFGCGGGITIGARTIIGQYVSMHAQDHHFDDIETAIMDQATSESGILIGDDCWIGAKSTILDGTIIGNHCVVAAGAVVKGHFPDNVIIAGVPAVIIRHLN